MATAFGLIYDRFLGKITDDMYLELTPSDTLRDLQNLLIHSIPDFEFPRKNLYNYKISTKEVPIEEYNEDTETGFTLWTNLTEDNLPSTVVIDESYFEVDLTHEEINILALLMKMAWVQRQVASIENTRMKYSGSDFKFTSQANHLSKLLTLLSEAQREAFHMQRLYKRRKLDINGNYISTWSELNGN